MSFSLLCGSEASLCIGDRRGRNVPRGQERFDLLFTALVVYRYCFGPLLPVGSSLLFSCGSMVLLFCRI